MKILSIIAGVLLGLIFLAVSIPFLLGIMPEQPPPPPGSPTAMFMGALGPTGYMKFIKLLELAGGILVAIPRTRNLGLLILGPIIVNIVAFWAFIARSLPPGPGLIMTGLAALLAVSLLVVERKAFASLLNPTR
jgi:hypothetical protein